MNIMDKTTAKISLHIDGMTWEQVREMIEERYGALMWDHKSTAYPTDSVVVRMAFAEPAGNVAQRAIGKAAPQQEAQEPVAWYVTGCGRLLDEDEAKAEARHIGGTARAIPLYTAPQPSPASQVDALDAARYRYLRDVPMDEWPDELAIAFRLQQNAIWDAAIDAARKQGENHD